jgi:hypothetical protein
MVAVCGQVMILAKAVLMRVGWIGGGTGTLQVLDALFLYLNKVLFGFEQLVHLVLLLPQLFFYFD